MAAIDSSIGINSTTHHITNRNPVSSSTLLTSPLAHFFVPPFQNQVKIRNTQFIFSPFLPLKCSKVENFESQQKVLTNIMSDPHSIDQDLLQKLVYDALVWSSLHGLVVGDRNVERSGVVPGVGMVHAPFALLPTPFPESHWKQACELAPIFNELVDRVSLDGKFLQESLSRLQMGVLKIYDHHVRGWESLQDPLL